MSKKKFEKTSLQFLNPKKIFILLTVFFILPLQVIFITSCGAFSTTQATKIDVKDSFDDMSSQNSFEETTKEEIDDAKTTIDNTDSTTGSDDNDTETTQATETSTQKDGLTIRVYYADAEAIYLVGEERLIKGSHKYFEAFIELMKPPITPGLIKLIPDTAKVNKITKTDSNIDIDLSQSFIDDRFMSHSIDMLLIYSIVNTMTEFPEINTVTFHFNGKQADTFGQMDLSEPFYRDASLIK